MVEPVLLTSVLARTAKSAARPRSIGDDGVAGGVVGPTDVAVSVARGADTLGPEVVDAVALVAPVGPAVPDAELDNTPVVTDCGEVSTVADAPVGATEPETLVPVALCELSAPPEAIAMMAMVPATAATTASGSQRRHDFAAGSGGSGSSDGEDMCVTLCADGVVTAVDVDDLARGGREPVAEQRDARSGNG